MSIHYNLTIIIILYDIGTYTEKGKIKKLIKLYYVISILYFTVW